MRKIKFRAWDKQANQWYNMDLFIIQNDGMYESLREFEDGISLTDKECDLMQYTGLRDKNDKDIYEGDILKTGTSYDKVFWNKSAWSTEVMKRHQEKGGWVVGHINVSFAVAAKYGEVIGNIYENPELLEDK